MKRSFFLKTKMKAVIALVVLMMVVLLHGMAGRQRVSELQRSVSSIYQDRLMPATYIFEITDHMYQKKLLLEHHTGANDRYAKHNGMIAGLVKQYDNTYLTPEEQQLWAQFKINLSAYNELEAMNTTGSLSPKHEQYFHNVLTDLHQLASLQAGEGKKLNGSSLSIAQGNATIAEMEKIIMMVLGLCVVVLITLPEKVTAREQAPFSLN